MKNFLERFFKPQTPKEETPKAATRDRLDVSGYEHEDPSNEEDCGTKKKGCGGCGCH